jgi:hypothetical protein
LLSSEPKSCSEIEILPQVAPTPGGVHLRDGRSAKLNIVRLGSRPGSCRVNPAPQAHYTNLAGHLSLTLRI